MNYDIKIKATISDVSSYYYQHTSTTLNSQSVYYGNIEDRAFWYDGSDWWNTTTTLIDDNTPGAGKYTGASLYGTLTDSLSAELTSSQYTIADAWYRAETTVFDSLCSFSGSTEEEEAFRGVLPTRNDNVELMYQNVWALTSGNSTLFEIDRLSGEDALWCSMRQDILIDSIWDSRERAMKFAGLVMAWLKETDNIAQTDNIQGCRLTELPNEPSLYIPPGERPVRLWRQEINLEMIYKTETVFA